MKEKVKTITQAQDFCKRNGIFFVEVDCNSFQKLATMIKAQLQKENLSQKRYSAIHSKPSEKEVEVRVNSGTNEHYSFPSKREKQIKTYSVDLTEKTYSHHKLSFTVKDSNKTQISFSLSPNDSESKLIQKFASLERFKGLNEEEIKIIIGAKLDSLIEKYSSMSSGVLIKPKKVKRLLIRHKGKILELEVDDFMTENDIMNIYVKKSGICQSLSEEQKLKSKLHQSMSN